MDTPIVDARTCREKQDEAINDLREQAADLREAIHLLRARVAALEAASPIVAVPILGTLDASTRLHITATNLPEVHR